MPEYEYPEEPDDEVELHTLISLDPTTPTTSASITMTTPESPSVDDEVHEVTNESEDNDEVNLEASTNSLTR